MGVAAGEEAEQTEMIREIATDERGFQERQELASSF